MQRLASAALVATSALFVGAARADQTLVFMRHGEKPEAGLGQIDCQGLNRALALPRVLHAKFGKPDAIYAPNPGFTTHDKGVEYNYIRPLATIEPTAIRLGMPVNSTFGFRQIDLLEQALLQPAYSSATIFVAWEHHLAEQAVRDLVASLGGDGGRVPAWADDDFDSIYVLHVDWHDGKPVAVKFERQAEGLDHRSRSCPD